MNVKEITQVINGKTVTFDEYSTALTHSAFIGDIDTCKWLLDHGTDVDGPDAFSDTALSNAVARGFLEICRLLLEHGADVNEKDPVEGWTALMEAARNGDADMCKFLIERGADVNGVTLLQYAEETDGLERIAKFLKSRSVRQIAKVSEKH